MKWLDVAVGVIRRGDTLLVSQRPLDAMHGGMWEFPGGKIESGEKIEDALARELHEEIHIETQDFKPLIEIRHDYGNWGVTLWVYEVKKFKGTPIANEKQLQVKWLSIQNLPQYPFPKANQAILELYTAGSQSADFDRTEYIKPGRVFTK